MRGAALLGCLLILAIPAEALPEQVHAGLVDGKVSVVWARLGDVRAELDDEVQWRTAGSAGSVLATEAYILPGTTIFTAEIPWNDTIQYRVGSDAHGWSEERTLELAPREGTWRFVAYGDHGTGVDSNRSIQIVPQVLAERPHAILHLGDLSYANGEAPIWDAWFRLVEPLASRTLYMAAPGNHEHEGYYAASHPSAAWATDTDSIADPYRQFTTRFHFAPDDLRYSFDIGPVHVTVINTEDLCVWQPVQYYVPWRVNPVCNPAQTASGGQVGQDPSLPNQALIDWTAADLAASNAPWKVVMFHQPVYSGGAYTGARVLRDHFVPLFEQHGVDLVLAGHDHNYQRSFPLVQHEPVTDAIEGYPAGAPIYIVSGGAGEGLYTFRDAMPAWTAARNATYHYVVLDVMEEGIRVQAVEVPTGVVLDSFTIGAWPEPAESAPEDVQKASPMIGPVALVVALLLRRVRAAP